MPEKRARPREPFSPNTALTPSLVSPPSPDPHPPKESSDESQPIKRPKPSEESVKPRKATMLDAALHAYQVLRAQHPDRSDFKASELIKADETVTGLRRTAPWRKSFTRTLNLKQHFLKVGAKYRPLSPEEQGKEHETALLEGAKAAPEEVYRPAVPVEWTRQAAPPVRLSTFDKSLGVKFIAEPSDNAVQGHKGYRMARATTGVCEGDWFFECQILPYEEEGAVRLGWSMRRSDVETPVGFDAYGFGIRDRTGEFIHRAHLKQYGEPFGKGDVIGCRIVLPKLSEEEAKKVEDAETNWLCFRFIHQLQGIMVAPADSGVDILNRASVQYYKNGRHLGIPEFFKEREANGSEDRQEVVGKTNVPQTARKEMRAGVYYPSVALYGNARVKANFGPEFRHGVPEGSRAMCEAAVEAMEKIAAEEAEARAKEKEKSEVVPERTGDGVVGKEVVEIGKEDKERVEQENVV